MNPTLVKFSNLLLARFVSTFYTNPTLLHHVDMSHAILALSPGLHLYRTRQVLWNLLPIITPSERHARTVVFSFVSDR